MVCDLVDKVDVLFVVGVKNSFNLNCLCEFVDKMGIIVYLIDDVSNVEVDWFNNVNVVGVIVGVFVLEVLV